MRFYPQALISAETGLPIVTLRGQSGIVVPVGSSTPLNLRDIDGNVIPNTPAEPIYATLLGFTPLFDTVEDVMEAEFLSGGLRTPLVSTRGLHDAAVAAQVSAAESALAAGQAVAPTREAIVSAIQRGGTCHMVISGGQSNATQADTSITYESGTDARVAKWDATSGTIELVTPGETYLATAFAREYAKTLPASDWVLIVQAAVGSTGFTSTSITPAPAGYHSWPSPGTWDRTLTTDPVNLYSIMVTRTLAARDAAQTIGTVVVDALLWSQGEEDTPFLTETEYAAKLDDLIATFRTDIGVPLLPVVVGSMVPEYARLRGQVNTAGVAAALAKTPTRNAPGNASFATAFVYGPEGKPKLNEVIHYSTAGQIERGRMFLDGLHRARVNRAATKPVPPTVTDITREANGRITMHWRHPLARVTSYDVEFSFDSGATWIAGAIDPDSRLRASTGAFAWESVQGRIRSKTDAGIDPSAWAYSIDLTAPRETPTGYTVQKFVGEEVISPTHTGAATLYAAFTHPASGGSAVVNARNTTSTRQFYLNSTQTGAVELAQVTTGGATNGHNFPAPKGAPGPHVLAASITGDGGTLVAKRDSEAATTVTQTPGDISMEVLKLTASGGTTMHGAYFFKGIAHTPAQMAVVQSTLALRHGITVP